MRNHVVLLFLLTGCVRIPQPWFAEVIPGVRPVVAKYDDDGLMHVLYMGDDDAIRYGTLDPDGKDRTVTDDGPLLLDGEPFPVAGYDADLAFRDNGELWGWIGGSVGPIANNSLETRLVLETSTDYFGALAFHGDRLHTGVQGTPWLSYPIGSDGTLGEPEPQNGTYEGSPRPLGSACRLWVVGDLAYAQSCDNEFLDTHLYPDGAIDLVTGEMHQLDTSGELPHSFSGGLAYTEGAAWIPDGCVVPLESDGGWISEAADGHIPVHDGECDGYDFVPSFQGHTKIELRPGAKSVVYAVWGSALILADENKPRDFKRDKTGTWCRPGTSMQSMTLGDGGIFTPPSMPYVYGYGQSQGSELLYATKKWSQSGDSITTSFSDPLYPDMGIDASDEINHWAVRVGDTLNIRTGHRKSEIEHSIDSGYVTLSGQWVPCGTL